MICISAFSTGNDYAHVQLTIHFKMVLEMSKLIQAQGCSGWDGKPTWCFIISASNPQLPKISKEAEDHKGQWYAYDYIYRVRTKQCLWYGMTLHWWEGVGMQGWPGQCTMLCLQSRVRIPCGIYQCQSCIQHWKQRQDWQTITGWAISVSKHELKDLFADATHMLKKRWNNRMAGTTDKANRIRYALDRVKDHGCGACLVMGFRPEHTTIHACQALQAAGGFGALMQWKKTIQYPPSVGRKGICWKCHILSCSDMLHGDFEGAKTKCGWHMHHGLWESPLLGITTG